MIHRSVSGSVKRPCAKRNRRSELFVREHRTNGATTKSAKYGLFEQWRSTQPVERSIPGAYKVGGRRVRKPTGLPRDSSLRIDKAPGISFSCREAQTASANIGRRLAERQRDEGRETRGR